MAESIVLIQKYLTQEYWKALEKAFLTDFFQHSYKGTLRTLIVIVLIFSGIFKGKSFFFLLVQAAIENKRRRIGPIKVGMFSHRNAERSRTCE